MVTDREILDYIFSKWGKKEEMRQLNEQHLYSHSYLHLEDFIPEHVSKALYEESKTIPEKYWTTFTRANSYMEECKDLEEAPM